MAPVDSTLIIFDIGQNVAEIDDKNKKSFFEMSRECITRIVERKIISRPNDLIGIILLGSNSTNNNLADQCPGSFTNIEFLSELVNPNWQMLRNMPEQVTNVNGDWFEAVLVAADYYKNCLHNVKADKFKIVLMTNFEHPANPGSNVETVIKGFQDENFEVTIIGPNIYDGLQGSDIELARLFVESTQGGWATFDDAMNYLLFHRKKSTKPMPWNVDLSIGPKIKIPVSVYGRIREDTIIKTWNKSVRDPVTGKSSTDVGITKKKEFVNVEDKTVVDVEDTISAYLYGQKAIPFSDSDKDLLYKSGPKCLSLYGFTKTNTIQWQNLAGNGVSYLFGRKGDKKAQSTIHCLINCMIEEDLVGIARRVYNNGNAPMMHVLFPILDSQNICLSVIGINFKEDIKKMAFPPTNIPKYSCNKEQVDAFKTLIESMNLMNAYGKDYDDREAFPTAETVNPAVQHILDCIAFRAMHPGKPIPPPRDDLMVLFKVPPLIEINSREAMAKLKNVLNLKKVVKQKSSKGEPNNLNDNSKYDQNVNVKNVDTDVPKVQLLNFNNDVMDIGTVNPVEDFKFLQSKGKSLNDLMNEMIDVLETMIICLNFNNDFSKNKVINALKFLREECIKNDPTFYNNWFKKFRKNLFENKHDNIISFLNENKLSFITSDENNLSLYTAGESDDDSQLYENNTVPDANELTIQSEVNMFDEM